MKPGPSGSNVPADIVSPFPGEPDCPEDCVIQLWSSDELWKVLLVAEGGEGKGKDSSLPLI